jgi:2-polyprenyl-3-methyl-5-hydroxy-6-metoxy-1,4-benzoquinol methylase
MHSKDFQAFKELASHYEETVDEELRKFWGWSYPDFVDQLVQRISVDGTAAILDVATGTGLIPRKISCSLQTGAKIVGLDLTFAALKQARQKTEANPQPVPIYYVHATAHAMPFAPGSFDCVVVLWLPITLAGQISCTRYLGCLRKEASWSSPMLLLYLIGSSRVSF